MTSLSSNKLQQIVTAIKKIDNYLKNGVFSDEKLIRGRSNIYKTFFLVISHGFFKSDKTHNWLQFQFSIIKVSALI